MDNKLQSSVKITRRNSNVAKRERGSIVKHIGSILKNIRKFVSGVLKIATLLLILSVIVASVMWGYMRPIVKKVRETEYEKLSNCNSQTFQLKTNTIIYDKNGKKIGKINSGNYIDTKVEDVSTYIKDGYIAVEDKNFKIHCGVDFKAIARAGLALVKNRGEIRQGASTITQQVVKNNLLSNEKTYFRKATEIMLAMDIEKEFNKSQIMEFYLNTNFYGHGCYGIGAACHYYFDCTPKDISPAQAAILMGISNAPTALDPVNNYDAAMKNKDFILKVMYEEGVIDKKQYEKSLSEKITIKQKGFKNKTSTSYQVTYALHCATIRLMEQDNFKFRYKFSSKKEQQSYEKKYARVYEEKYQDIRSGGYKIYTSIDKSIQKTLQKSVDDQLASFSEKDSNGIYKMQGAAVCIDNETNYVVAIVGGRSKSGEYNRAYQSARQPGSSIKPIVAYGPAFDTGLYSPSSRIDNTKVTGTYAPKNWDGKYTESQSIRDAIRHSTNAVAYRTLKNIGIDTGLEYLSSMKFSTLSFADDNNYAIALGGFTNGVSPVDMAKAYNALANSGKYSERTCIVSIVTPNGEKYNSNVEETKQVYSEDTAYMITSCLKGVVESGTGTLAKVNNQVVAGKTGTTNSNKDSWFCGYSKYYTTTVWTGYDNPREIYDTSKSAKIFSDFMTKISSDKKKCDFERPSTTVLKYTDASGKAIKNVDESFYKENVKIDFNSMDYFSTKKAKGLSKERKDEISNDTYNKALKALQSFETYTISDVDSAINLHSVYEKTKKKINKIDDEYTRAPLIERLENRYDALIDIYNEWAAYINEYQKSEHEKKVADQKIKDSDSAYEASAKLKGTRISNVDFYLEKLRGRIYYDEGTKKTIDLLNKALEKIKGYSDYNSYKAMVDSAVTQAKNLPQKESLPYSSESETKVNNRIYNNQINND